MIYWDCNNIYKGFPRIYVCYVAHKYTCIICKTKNAPWSCVLLFLHSRTTMRKSVHILLCWTCRQCRCIAHMIQKCTCTCTSKFCRMWLTYTPQCEKCAKLTFSIPSNLSGSQFSLHHGSICPLKCIRSITKFIEASRSSIYYVEDCRRIFSGGMNHHLKSPYTYKHPCTEYVRGKHTRPCAYTGWVWCTMLISVQVCTCTH